MFLLTGRSILAFPCGAWARRRVPSQSRSNSDSEFRGKRSSQQPVHDFYGPSLTCGVTKLTTLLRGMFSEILSSPSWFQINLTGHFLRCNSELLFVNDWSYRAGFVRVPRARLPIDRYRYKSGSTSWGYLPQNVLQVFIPTRPSLLGQEKRCRVLIDTSGSRSSVECSSSLCQSAEERNAPEVAHAGVVVYSVKLGPIDAGRRAIDHCAPLGQSRTVSDTPQAPDNVSCRTMA